MSKERFVVFYPKEDEREMVFCAILLHHDTSLGHVAFSLIDPDELLRFENVSSLRDVYFESDDLFFERYYRSHILLEVDKLAPIVWNMIEQTLKKSADFHKAKQEQDNVGKRP